MAGTVGFEPTPPSFVGMATCPIVVPKYGRPGRTCTYLVSVKSRVHNYSATSLNRVGPHKRTRTNNSSLEERDVSCYTMRGFKF